MRLSTCFMWFMCLVVSGCEERHPSLTPVDEGVVCSGLVLEVDDAHKGVRSVISADRAVFDDLPGRSEGRLDSVEVHVSSTGASTPGLSVVTATARAAIVEPGGSMRLDGATLAGGEGDALFMTAATLRIGADGGLSARGVRARLRSQ